MISRRSFLAALAGLPFVGKLIPQRHEDLVAKWYGDIEQWRGSEDKRVAVAYARDNEAIYVMTERDYMTTSHDAHMCEGTNLPCGRYQLPAHRPRLTFAEWDRKYQSNDAT